MEKIGFIPKAELADLKTGLHPINPELLQTKLRFADRSKVETDNQLLQPICIASLTTSDSKIFVVRKTPTAADCNSPEHDKLLLYIGGHMNPCDQQSFTRTVRREVLEEIGIDLDFSDIQPFCIYTPTTTKSAHHLAICFPLTISTAEFVPSLTSNELAIGSHSGVFMILAELLDIESYLEPWSQLILHHFIANQTGPLPTISS